MMYRVIIPGKPIGKGRPRFGNGRTYTPEATREWEGMVRRTVERECASLGIEPARGPVRVSIRAYFEIPRSRTRAQKDECRAGQASPGKPDIDNLAKIVMDSLNGLVYRDDVQVQRLSASKEWCDGEGESPRVEVSVEWNEGE